MQRVGFMSLITLLLCGLVIVSPVVARPAQQSPYNGQIISPAPNSEGLRGQVEIIGVATHPDFAKYDVFVLTGRPEDDWIQIATSEQRVDSPALLAVWDTTQIPDGSYILLLRVWDKSGGMQDFPFSFYTVANNQPTEPPTPEPTSTAPPPTIPVQTPTVIIEQPPTATSRPSPTPGGPPTATPTPEPSVLSNLEVSAWQQAFCNGATIVAGLFALWAIGLILRAGVRFGWKQLRQKQYLPPGQSLDRSSADVSGPIE